MENEVKTRKNQGWVVTFVTIAIIIIMTVIIELVLGSVTIPFLKENVNVAALWLGAGLAYTIISWRFWDPIGPDKIGVRVIMGFPFDTVSSGPPFAPLGVAEIRKYPTATVQREFPAEPELIFRPKKDESEMIPEGSDLIPPLRITFANQHLTEDRAKEIFVDFFRVTRLDGGEEQFREGVVDKEDGLGQARVTAEVSHLSRYRIFNAVRFTIAVPPHPETGEAIDEVFRQIEDEQVVALNTILVQMTVAQAMKNIAWINTVLFKKVCRRINADEKGHSEQWGIDLEGSAIKPIQFHRDLNDAIGSVAEGIHLKRRTITDAEGKKEALILEGDGTASAERASEREKLTGRAEGLKAVAKVSISQSGRAAMGAEVAREVAKGGNTIVVGTGGMEQIIGLAAAASAGTKKKVEEK